MIALTLLAVVVTCYGTRSYYVNKFCVDGDTYALFGYVVQLLGLEFDDLYKQADLALYESKKVDGFAADIAGKTV